MAVRTAYAGTALTGDVYSAANHARMPGGWIGYAEVTANQAIQDADSGGLETDLTGLSVAVTVGSNRRVRITGHASLQLDDPLGNPSVIGRIREGATQRGVWADWDLNAASGLIFDRARFSFEGGIVLTPTAGAHTYKLTLQALAGADILLAAAAGAPAWILVEDLGPAT
jgi:hypothetical protein